MIATDRLVSVTMAGSPAERVEPITLARTKAHLRIASESEDDLIRGWIGAARAYLEEYGGRQTIEAVYEYTTHPIGRTIELPRAPLVQVLSVISLDGDTGGETVLSPDTYRVVPSGVASGSPATIVCDAYCPPGAIALLNGASWPTGTIRVQRICGYGPTPDHIPTIIQAALYALVGHFYRNRAEVTAESLQTLPMGAQMVVMGLKYTALVVQQ